MEVDVINLFSLGRLEYGSSSANFTALIIVIGICALLCFHARKLIAVCAAGIAAFFVFIFVLGPLHAGYDQALRYFTPIVIGLYPAVVGWTAVCAPNRARVGWVLLVAAVPVAAFTPAVLTRVHWAVQTHSVASYPWLALDPDYMTYNRKVLHGTEQSEVKALQEKIPVGETILAWVNTPFYLDYKRNPILDMEPAGIGEPWAEMPRVKYLIWDYRGYATRERDYYEQWALDVGKGERRNAALALDFIHRLEELVKTGKVLFDNGEIKIVQLEGRGSR